MKCLKKCVIFCMLLMLLIPSGVFAADSYEFDEYGFKIDAGTNMIKARPASIAWEELASKKNVPLNKVWTVEFSDKVTMDKIAGIAIERNGEFIPVKISLMQGNKVSVTPADKFTGSTEYTLKVFLENGKNYKMDFTTVSEMRNVDDEPNYNYTDASSIYINETVKGSFAEDDYNDFYKVTLPQDGRLDITAVQLDGGKLRVYLYGQNGDDGSSIDYTYDSTTANLSKGLQAGTYYIKVYYSNYYGEYELTNSFTPQTIQNDSAQSSYIKAPQLELNKTKQGHIGYLSDTNVYNANDFYKITLPQDGTLDITATQLDGGKLRVYLYGQNGDDGSSIDYTYDSTTANLSKGLQAGTYYIKVYYSNYYGGYELTNSFTPQTAQNDSAQSSYIKAPQLELNKTKQGHIGYLSDTNGYNANDFYKIALPQDGTLDITATHLDGGKLRVYLYGQNGDDGSAIDYTYDTTTGRISKVLQAGTYYIKVYYSSYYGGYSLTNSFK